MTGVPHVHARFFRITLGVWMNPGAGVLAAGLLAGTHEVHGFIMPPPCTASSVDVSTRPGPPPRGARTFLLLPAPGNHASSSFNLASTPSPSAIPVVDASFSTSSHPINPIHASSRLRRVEIFSLNFAPFRPAHPYTCTNLTPSSAKSPPPGMPSYAIRLISLLRN